jgi:integrase/recombinase XerD
MRGLPSVTLYIRRNNDGRQRYERVSSRNPQVAQGSEVYCLHFYENGKRRWITVGNDLRVAYAARGTKEQELASEEPKVPPTPKPSPDTPASLETLREEFLSDKRTSRKKNGELRDEETIRAYETLTREFVAFVRAATPALITAKILKAWITSLYTRKRRGSEEQVSHRTVVNLYINTVCFLHFVGIDHKKLVPEAERPAAIEEEPEAYTQAELSQFFTAVNEERDRLAFMFLHLTGAREREMTHLEWSNLNLGERPTVTFRNQGGFKTKTRKFRTVPLDPALTAALRIWKLTHGNDKYVFGRKDGEVEGHYLRRCKEYAKAAGLDQERFWLHKFRDTAATEWLRHGAPLRAVQKWMGHASITMTERYLAPEQDDVQQMIMSNIHQNRADVWSIAESATA